MAEEVALHSKNGIKLHVIDNRQLLLSSTQPDEIYFTGKLNVKTLLGSIEIMGFNLSPKHSGVTVLSSKEECILKISMLKNSSSHVDRSHIQALNFSASLMHELLSNLSISHLVLLTKNGSDNSLVSVLKNYDMPVFFKENIDKPVAHCFGQDLVKFHKYREPDKWHTIFDKLAKRKHPRTVLCGGKGVGKSTLLRFLLNKSLSRWSEVIVIDFDPGQPEFTVMGCLSVVSVQQPVIGPNFSHLVTPDKSLYFGNIAVSDFAEKYIRCVKILVHHCQTNFSRVPWFINTMGFNEGLGIKLLFEALENIRPTDIIQIISCRKKDNFPQSLIPEFWKTEGFTTSKLFKYELHCLSSVAELKDVTFDITSWGLNSATRRNIVTLSYFSQITPSDGNLWSSIPRKISLKNIKIFVDKLSSEYIPTVLSKFQVVCSINANLVALCHAEADDDLMDCIGFGIVRGVDEDAEELFLITPLSDAELLQISIIRMSSSIQLPDVVYQKQFHPANSHVPYVMQVSKDILHQKIKKSSSRIKHS